MCPEHIAAEIYFLHTEEGGRSHPVFQGYRPQFYYDDRDWIAECRFPEIDELGQVNLGDTVQASVWFMSPQAHVGKLYAGKEFLLREGARTVARGTVTKLVTLENAAQQGKS